MSLRNVVTSCGWLLASRTATVPCSMPTGTVRLKTFWTAAGGAEVVRSKSWFSRPSRLSRIAADAPRLVARVFQLLGDLQDFGRDGQRSREGHRETRNGTRDTWTTRTAPTP